MFVPESIPGWNVEAGAGDAKTGVDSMGGDVVELSVAPDDPEPLGDPLSPELEEDPVTAERLVLPKEEPEAGEPALWVERWRRAALPRCGVWASIRASCARLLRQRARLCDAQALWARR